MCHIAQACLSNPKSEPALFPNLNLLGFDLNGGLVFHQEQGTKCPSSGPSRFSWVSVGGVLGQLLVQRRILWSRHLEVIKSKRG